jgi:hypothetical protein
VQFRAKLQLDGKTATGITVPDDIVEALGGGNRPRVRVTIEGFAFPTTVGRMGGEFKIPVSTVVREQAGVAAGDELDVTIQLDTAPREVAVPPELAAALAGDKAAERAFTQLSYSTQKRHVLTVEGAKAAETREGRIAKVLAELRG